MEIKEIVNKLIGPIDPIGDTNIDAEHLENLKKLTDLIDKLLYDISQVAANDQRPEISMRKSGIYAKQFLKEIKDAF